MSRLLEAGVHEVDKGWIEGIRKTWKAWVKKSRSFPGYVTSATSIDHALIQQASLDAVAYLEEGRSFIRRLREDLLINKGFWTRLVPDEEKTKKVKGERDLKAIKSPVITLLREAEEAISDGIERARAWVQLTHPEHGRDKDLAYKSQEDFDRFLRTVSLSATEAVTNADAIVSRKLLRHLSSVVTQAGGTIDFEGYAPTELKVGDTTIVFHDTPTDPTRKADQQHTRHPYNRDKYIQTFKNAKALLDRRKLGFLWYGRIEVHAQSRAPENHLGAHFGTGAEYYRQGDYVKVYADPQKLERLVVHELAHRYWYKYMTYAQRERFGEWFGKVKATTAYGATVSAEDFAEVFADYVMGTDLTRDQVDRLKAFLGGKDKLEDLVQRLRALVESAEGDCFRYAYKRVQKGGTLVHATVIHPWTKKPFDHAWVEDDGKAYDWQTSQGLGKGKPRMVAEFRELWKPSAEKTYTADEAKVQVLRTKHYGPWD